jgi:hypothetical protein
MSRVSSTGTRRLPADLGAEIQACRYFPELIADTVAMCLGAEQPLAHLVHQEATFNRDEIQRHLTVLVLTPTRLLVCHTDENGEPGVPAQALTTSESVGLGKITSVALSQVVTNAERYGSRKANITETWLAIAWGTMRRIDLEPTQCPDPNCEADHGLSGMIAAEDLTVRISTAADGPDKVQQLLSFATALQQVTGLAR